MIVGIVIALLIAVAVIEFSVVIILAFEQCKTRALVARLLGPSNDSCLLEACRRAIDPTDPCQPLPKQNSPPTRRIEASFLQALPSGPFHRFVAVSLVGILADVCRKGSDAQPRVLTCSPAWLRRYGSRLPSRTRQPTDTICGCMRTCVRACVRACTHACVRA